MQLQSLSGLKLMLSTMLSLNPRAGRPTSATLREAIAITFPAVRDIHQLRAVLGGIPLCEVHGTARTDLHRQGILLGTLMTSEVQAPLKGSKMPTPSPTGTQGMNSTGPSIHIPLDGPHDFETSPSEARYSSRPSPECPIRRRHTTVEMPWDLGLSRRFTVIDHTARAYAGRGLIRHRQGAHRSSIGGWSVFFARTPPQSQEKLNGSLWA